MKPEKLLMRARSSPASLRFRELCRLAEAVGFTLRGSRGSHRIYTHPRVRELMNFQEVGGLAKPYQVRQLLAVIDDYRLVIGGEK